MKATLDELHKFYCNILTESNEELLRKFSILFLQSVGIEYEKVNSCNKFIQEPNTNSLLDWETYLLQDECIYRKLI